MINPLELASSPLVIEFSIGAVGAPTVEPLSDGRVLFKVMAEGTVSGDLNGVMRSSITEVNPKPPVYQGVSISFSIETDDGTLEGYYVGSIHHPTDRTIANISAHGHILTVSALYADLFLAEIIVVSEVQFVNGRSTGETGTITISPR